MSLLFWVLLGSVGVAIISMLAKRWSFQRLPDHNDREFVKVYKQAFGGDDGGIIRERNFIASVLGVPYQKLHPDHRFEDLSKLRFDVGYEVGMGDLEEELRELFEKASLEFPSNFPATVGQLIHEMITAKKVIQSGTSGNSE